MAYSVVTKTYLFGAWHFIASSSKQVSFCHNTVCHWAFSLLYPTARLTLHPRSDLHTYSNLHSTLFTCGRGRSYPSFIRSVAGKLGSGRGPKDGRTATVVYSVYYRIGCYKRTFCTERVGDSVTRHALGTQVMPVTNVWARG